MDRPDIRSNITAHLCNSELEKLFLAGLISLSSLSNLNLNQRWWRSRVYHLCGCELDESITNDWKVTYTILERELSRPVPSLWNAEDNVIACFILMTLSSVDAHINRCLLSGDVLVQAARYGSSSILLFLSQLVNEEDRNGLLSECLEVAAGEGHLHTVRCILELGIKFDQQQLENVLCAACSARWDIRTCASTTTGSTEEDEYYSIVCELLEIVAVVPERALMKCLKYSENTDIFSLVFSKIDKVSGRSLCYAIERKRYTAISLIIEEGSVPAYGGLPTALQNEDWKMLEFLLERVDTSIIPEEIARECMEELVDCCTNMENQVHSLDVLLTRPEMRAVVDQDIMDYAPSHLVELLEAALTGAL